MMKVIFIFYLTLSIFCLCTCEDEIHIEKLFKAIIEKAGMETYLETIETIFHENWNGTCELTCPNNRNLKIKFFES